MALMPQTVRDLGAALELFVGTLPPLTLVRRNANFTVPNGALTDIPWDFEDVDTLGAYAGTGAAHPERVTIPAGMDGLFNVSATLQFNGASSGTIRALFIQVNGSPIAGNSGISVVSDYGSQISTARAWPLVAGDYVTAAVFQTSGGTADIGAGAAGTNLMVARM